MVTAAFLGALLGFALWYMFANRVRRKHNSSIAKPSR
jgi:membrane protein DedA with SNARE-associated domain